MSQIRIGDVVRLTLTAAGGRYRHTTQVIARVEDRLRTLDGLTDKAGVLSREWRVEDVEKVTTPKTPRQSR